MTTDITPPGRTGPVVVGVDWTSRSVPALRWAAVEAGHRGVALIAVHACSTGQPVAPYAPVPPERPNGAERISGECAHLRAVLTEALGATAGVEVRPICDLRPAVPALLAHGKEAGLLILAAVRRESGGVALGSTALACLRNAPCPVVLLPVDL